MIAPFVCVAARVVSCPVGCLVAVLCCVMGKSRLLNRVTARFGCESVYYGRALRGWILLKSQFLALLIPQRRFAPR